MWNTIPQCVHLLCWASFMTGLWRDLDSWKTMSPSCGMHCPCPQAETETTTAAKERMKRYNLVFITLLLFCAKSALSDYKKERPAVPQKYCCFCLVLTALPVAGTTCSQAFPYPMRRCPALAPPFSWLTHRLPFSPHLWLRGQDSNPRPPGYGPGTLTSALPRNDKHKQQVHIREVTLPPSPAWGVQGDLLP